MRLFFFKWGVFLRQMIFRQKRTNNMKVGSWCKWWNQSFYLCFKRVSTKASSWARLLSPQSERAVFTSGTVLWTECRHWILYCKCLHKQIVNVLAAPHLQAVTKASLLAQIWLYHSAAGAEQADDTYTHIHSDIVQGRGRTSICSSQEA